MSTSSLAAALPVDGRQSRTALAVARGTTRLLHSLGFSVVSELPLASGRRADLVTLDSGGEVWIVEIKSSIADFRADRKWIEYRPIVCEAPEHRLHATTRKRMTLAFARAAAMRLAALCDPEGPYGLET
jgi:hypothetical protein